MGSELYKIGNRIKKYFLTFFLLWFINSCTIDKMDCRLVVINQMKRDIYICTTARSNTSEKLQCIKNFNVVLQGYKESPAELKISSTKINSRKVCCMKPGETQHAEMIYVYIFNIDSLIRSYEQKLDIEHFDDYHVLCYSIEELESLKWEITLDSLEFRDKICR
jgi:hypothetical protein